MAARGIGYSYFGKAGHLFVMSEILLRGWNVAIPEIDQGDDIFVVKHDNGDFRRVQVKYSNAKELKKSLSVVYTIARTLIYPPVGSIYFALVIRHKSKWSHLFIISSDELQEFTNESKVQSSKSIGLNISISSNGKNAKLFKKDFNTYLNNFSHFPFVPHVGLKSEPIP